MAQSEQTSGMMSGGGLGFQIGGPVGFMVGAAVGGIFGGSSMRKRRRREAIQLKKDTKQAYTITKEGFKDLKSTRENIQNTFARNVGSSFAGLASSGRTLDESARQRITGGYAQIRDSELTSIDTREEAFKKSTGYKLVQDDYNYLSQINTIQDQSNIDVGTPTAYSIRTEGRSGESFFTDEQKGLLRSYEDPDNYQERNNTANFQAYTQSIMPTIDEYFTSQFGSDEDKASFEQTMTDRITSANEIYDESLLQMNVANQRRRDNLFGD